MKTPEEAELEAKQIAQSRVAEPETEAETSAEISAETSQEDAVESGDAESKSPEGASENSGTNR